jgi:CMP-N-acetylneuraminic acid synthetase
VTFFKDNGNVYITEVQSYLQSKIRVSGKTCLYKTGKFESMQIDDIVDFTLMEKMYEYHGDFL